MTEQRLDAYLSANNFVKSRSIAQVMIKNGDVSVNGEIVTKSSYTVTDDDDIELVGEVPRYVSRGGLKLEKALSEFKLDVNGLICLDIGASTGGFTDCLLQNGAEKVYAVDVGTAQLDVKLLNDSRVVSLEQLDIRNADESRIPERINFICTDVSFISLKLILPEIKRFLKSGCIAVALIKPQFEAGKAYLNKNGIVKDLKVHKRVIDEITSFARSLGLVIIGVCDSPIEGGDGNKEYLLCLRG